LLEGFLGYIADKYIGEKEILVTGFIILAGSTALMSFVDSNSFWIWALVLFMTRVGASMIEIMTETYFFKKITSTDVSIIGAFRMTRPFIYTLSPLLGSLLLFVIDSKYLFLLLGIFMLYGIRHALILHDTR
jgi:MFS family permease